MQWTKSKTHPNWIYDDVYDEYISPKGRTAPYPGAPFTGQISAYELELIKEAVDKENIPLETRELVKENMKKKELNVEVVKTLKIGDVTVNLIRVT